MTYEYLVQQIKENRGRMTPQRELIMHLLIDHQQVLLTVDELLTMCQKENPDINMTTIYRNLELLEKLNLLYKMNTDRSTSGYKLVCTGNHHHHIICNACGKMFPIDFCPMTEELTAMAKASGFTITEHKLELYGLCSACRKSGSTTP